MDLATRSVAVNLARRFNAGIEGAMDGVA